MFTFFLLTTVVVLSKEQSVAGFDFHIGATQCLQDRVLGCHKRGQGDEGGCCQQDSVCLTGGDGLQQCFPLDPNRKSRAGHRCDHRGNTQAERDAMCDGYNVCARKGHDGRTYGCDDYYCCAYPTDPEYWANYQEPPCVEVEGWEDSYGDTCEWYAGEIERCDIYGEISGGSYFEPAKESCCYCKEGDAGGPAANDGRFCTWKTENAIQENWKVDLGASDTIYKDCWFFEQRGGRCRGSWGTQVGDGGLTAQDVCCICRFGRVVQHWGRTIDDDGNALAASKLDVETEVGLIALESVSEMEFDDSFVEGLIHSLVAFATTDSDSFNVVDFAIYGFAVIGIAAAVRGAHLALFSQKRSHSPIPDQEI